MKTKPAYLDLHQAGILEERAENLAERLESCDLCPRNCGINRLKGETGICGVGKRVWVTSHGPHFGEENPLRGWKGSGTIFFSGCNLNCLYCQNADISQRLSGVKVSTKRLASMMLELENRGCHNINLVSPTHVAAQILLAVAYAADLGLRLPIVYNTGGYDSISTLRMLDGVVDIYMPDMKYSKAEVGSKFSGIAEYPRVNQEAVLEMHRQVGDLKLDPRGIAERGLLIRHLVLPGNLAGSKLILEFLADKVSQNTYINVMDQYRPAYQAYLHPELNRRITPMEYQHVLDLAKSLGLTRLDLR
jgi:putative pyruvate formate lyase activating enzyme